MEVPVSSQYFKENVFVLFTVKVEVEQKLLITQLLIGFQLLLIELVDHQLFVFPCLTIVAVQENLSHQPYLSLTFLFVPFEYFRLEVELLALLPFIKVLIKLQPQLSDPSLLGFAPPSLTLLFEVQRDIVLQLHDKSNKVLDV